MKEEAVEDQAQAQAQAAPKKKPKSLKLILLVLFLLGFFGESGFLIWTKFFNKNPETKSADKKDTKLQKKGSKDGSGAQAHALGALALEPFLVNLSDAPSNRYARVTIKLGLNLKQDEIIEKMAKNEVAISKVRDEILSILSAKKSDELITNEGKKALRKEIIERLNKVLPEGEQVEEVFFTDFIVQL
jgi:flagellar FliL protein